MPLIRTMRLPDVAEVEALDREIFGTSIGKEALVKELTENPLAHYFVLEDQTTHELMGHIGIWIDDKNAQILNIFVKPAHRDQGYGKMIIKHTLAYLRQHQCENLTLEVRPSNQKAIRFYEKFGFVRATIRKNYYENGEDAILMWRKMDNEE